MSSFSKAPSFVVVFKFSESMTLKYTNLTKYILKV